MRNIGMFIELIQFRIECHGGDVPSAIANRKIIYDKFNDY
jgi:hypothetical protein